MKEKWGSLGKNINGIKWMKLEEFDKLTKMAEQKSNEHPSIPEKGLVPFLHTLDVFPEKLGCLFRFVWI